MSRVVVFLLVGLQTYCGFSFVQVVVAGSQPFIGFPFPPTASQVAEYAFSFSVLPILHRKSHGNDSNYNSNTPREAPGPAKRGILGPEPVRRLKRGEIRRKNDLRESLMPE